VCTTKHIVSVSKMSAVTVVMNVLQTQYRVTIKEIDTFSVVR
jgi:hypothetical protein